MRDQHFEFLDALANMHARERKVRCHIGKKFYLLVPSCWLSTLGYLMYASEKQRCQLGAVRLCPGRKQRKWLPSGLFLTFSARLNI